MTLTSNTLEIGLRTWVVETCMRSWKRREIRSGVLTSYERNLRWEEMLLGSRIVDIWIVAVSGDNVKLRNSR